MFLKVTLLLPQSCTLWWSNVKFLCSVHKFGLQTTPVLEHNNCMHRTYRVDLINFLKYARTQKRTIPSFAVHFLLVPGWDPSERHTVHIYSIHILHCIYILIMPHACTVGSHASNYSSQQTFLCRSALTSFLSISWSLYISSRCFCSFSALWNSVALSLYFTQWNVQNMHLQHRSCCYTVWMLHLSNSDDNIMPATQLSKQYIQSAAWCSCRHLNQFCT